MGHVVRMEITVDRDSVAAGDDADRHDCTVDVPPETPEPAQRYAPFARWSVDQVVAHLTAASPM